PDDVAVLPGDDVVSRAFARLNNTVSGQVADVSPTPHQGRFGIRRGCLRGVSESHRTSDGDIDLVAVYCGALRHEMVCPSGIGSTTRRTRESRSRTLACTARAAIGGRAGSPAP